MSILHSKTACTWERRRLAAIHESMTFVSDIADIASLREGGGTPPLPKNFSIILIAGDSSALANALIASVLSDTKFLMRS